MAKKINIKKAVEFIEFEHSSIIDCMIFMAFDNDIPKENVSLEEN